ncbi:MAG: HDOD domain-containing protein [Candidatus Cloacimonadota bacterium]|nr:HDOD domain-containing protein [Candidatus Cloacimonadota bacterium]
MNRRQTILEKLNKISQSDKKIVAMASAVKDFNSLIENKDLENVELAEFIEKDPIMTAFLLKNVNSSYYGFTVVIDSVLQAVNMLGIGNVKNLFLSSFMQRTFMPDDKKLWNDLWKHSLGVALIAENLSKYNDNIKKEHLFTAGLMHDIGSFILYFYLEDEAKPVFEALEKDDNKRLLIHEKNVLGITHDEIGYLFAKVWKFPDLITNCIRYHHKTSSGGRKYNTEISIIKVANSLAKAFEFGVSKNFFVEPIPNHLWRELDFPESEIPDLVKKFKEDFNELTGFIK